MKSLESFGSQPAQPVEPVSGVFRRSHSIPERTAEAETQSSDRGLTVVSAARTAEELMGRIERSETSSERKLEVACKLRERTRQYARRCAQAFSVVSLFGLAKAVRDDRMDFERTEGHVVVSSKEKGEVEFAHSDEQTTHILNYLSGKEELSDEAKFDIMRESLTVEPPEGFGAAPSNFAFMKLRDYVTFMVKERHVERRPGDPFEQGLSSEATVLGRIGLGRIPTKYNYNHQIYLSLWQMEQAVGAPRIRWMIPRKHPEVGSDSRAYYQTRENVMYIVPYSEEAQLDVFAEASHAQQFRNDHFMSVLKETRDYLDLSVRLFAHGSLYPTRKERSKLYDEIEYATPGSIEEEAHQHIEPELKRTYGAFLSPYATIAKNDPKNPLTP